MNLLKKLDKELINWCKKYGISILRYSLAIVFIWFGIQKPLGISPAQELVTNTVYWFSPTWFVPVLGIWEVVIGLCLLYKPLIKIGLYLMIPQMLGTFLPLIILPEVIFNGNFFALTLEGQFIIKNLVMLSAALVIAAHLHDK